MNRRVFIFTAVAVGLSLLIGSLVAPQVLTQSKVTICHYPPGNPENAKTITVGVPALPAHQSHGDTIGACS